MSAEPDDVVTYFRDRGFELTIVERDLHAEAIAAGEPGRASCFVEGRRYHCVDLVRGEQVTPRYAYGDSPNEALARARQRYGSEQG